MKVLCFLQNQWFRQPDRVRAILARNDSTFRRIFIARTLFMGCKTGQMLLKCWGSNWINHIVFEEASPQVGGKSSSLFPADAVHMASVIEEVEPRLIVALGGIAIDGIRKVETKIRVIKGPHPAARDSGMVINRLGEILTELNLYLWLTTGDSWK